MEDLTGKIIDKYQIIRQIGHGGMAVVYLAKDNLNRYVAIKMILSDAFSRNDYERIQKRFMIEAQTIARLRHPNITEVYAYGEYEGAPYLVMDYISGGTLKQIMGTKFPYQQAAALLAPVAEALAYAHRNHVLHRDVKPANILLTMEGKPVLGDFGIAKILEKDHSDGTLTEANTGVGTPEYMSPEQCMGDREIDGRTDEYSLGIIFYEMCTGSKPFSGKTSVEVMWKQIKEKLPKNWERTAGLPNRVTRVIKKALEKDPDDRYADIGEFAEKLRELSREPLGEVLPAHKVVSEEDDAVTRDEIISPDTVTDIKTENGRSAKRNPLPIFILIGAVIAAAAIFFGKNYLPGLQPDPTETPLPTWTFTPTETLIPTATDTPEPTVTDTPEPTATDTPEPTATDTPEPTATDTPEPTATDTPEPTETDTPEPTATDTPEPTATNTPEPTATDTPEPTATDTPEPTATDTPEPTATNTPKPTATDTPEPTATDTPEPTATDTPEPTATDTPEPTATDTPKPTATDTPEPTATDTPEPTATDTPEPTATDTPEPTATDTPEPTAVVTGHVLENTELRITADSERKDSFKNPVMVKADGIEKYSTRARAQKNGRETAATLKPGDIVIYTGERYDLGSDIMLKVRTQDEKEGYIYIGYLQTSDETDIPLDQLTENDRINGQESGPAGQGSADTAAAVTPTPANILVPGINFGHTWDPDQDNEILTGNTIELGIFDDKPIRWFVLDSADDGGITLLSEIELKRDSYNKVASIATTWENSDIRKWLNGEFLDEVFPAGSRLRGILRTTVLKNAYGYFDSEHPSGSTPDTEDTVYLLSVPEYTAYRSIINECEKYSPANKGVKPDFWLRSQGFDPARGASAEPEVNNLTEVTRQKGIRPVITIDKEQLETYFRTSTPSAVKNFGHVWDPAGDETVRPGYTLELGSYNGENLRWIVLDDHLSEIPGKLLLLSEQIISNGQYNSAAVITTTWETSDIRNRLNSEFLNSAFPGAGILSVYPTETETGDTVFLLSEPEYRTYRTLIEGYDAYMAKSSSSGEPFKNSEFWLRTTGTDNTRAMSTSVSQQVTDPSRMRITVLPNTLVTNTKGVRPAIVIEPEALRELRQN